MLFGYGLLGVQTLLQIGAFMSDAILRNNNYYVHWAIICVVIALAVAVLAFLGIQESLKISLVLAGFEFVIVSWFSIMIISKGGCRAMTLRHSLQPHAQLEVRMEHTCVEV